jgi:hypothetical protein
MASTKSVNFNLDWSFQPLNIWLRWSIGVNALTINNTSRKIVFYQLTTLAFHFVCQVYVINYVTHEPASVIVSLDPSHNKTTTNKWNTIIDYINWTSVAIVCHITILTISRHRFPILMSCFRRSTDLLDVCFYIKFRRLSFICVACIILYVSLPIFQEVMR